MRMPVKLDDGTLEVDVKLLPDGRALVHWLQERDDGRIVLSGHAQLREFQGRQAEGRYRVACRPEQDTVSSQKRGRVRFVCITSGDLAAVTCPKCLEVGNGSSTSAPNIGSVHRDVEQPAAGDAER